MGEAIHELIAVKKQEGKLVDALEHMRAKYKEKMHELNAGMKVVTKETANINLWLKAQQEHRKEMGALVQQEMKLRKSVKSQKKALKKMLTVLKHLRTSLRRSTKHSSNESKRRADQLKRESATIIRERKRLPGKTKRHRLKSQLRGARERVLREQKQVVRQKALTAKKLGEVAH